MNPIRLVPGLALTALAAAAVLAAAPAAPARAPSTAEQGSMDWLLQRLAKDREEENKGSTVVDPLVAFAKGDSPLEGETGWKGLVNIVLGAAKPAAKAEAASALVDRFTLEIDRRSKIEDEVKRQAEVKALWAVRLQVARATCNNQGMLSSNSLTLACVLRIQKAVLPPEWVTWKDTDPLRARKKAYDDLVKRLPK